MISRWSDAAQRVMLDAATPLLEGVVDVVPVDDLGIPLPWAEPQAVRLVRASATSFTSVPDVHFWPKADRRRERKGAPSTLGGLAYRDREGGIVLVVTLTGRDGSAIRTLAPSSSLTVTFDSLGFRFDA